MHLRGARCVRGEFLSLFLPFSFFSGHFEDAPIWCSYGGAIDISLACNPFVLLSFRNFAPVAPLLFPCVRVVVEGI